MTPSERRVANLVFRQHRLGYAAIVVTVLLPMAAAIRAMFVVRDLDVTLPLYWLAAVGGFGLYLLTQRWFAPRVLAEEQAWLNSLDFKVLGWFDTLGVEVPVAGQLLITLEFLGQPPSRRDLDKGLAAVNAERATGDSLAYLSPRIRVRNTERASNFTTRHYRDWQIRLVQTVLIPLHARHPLGRVQISLAR